MTESTTQMHPDSAGAKPKVKEVRCPVDGTPFVPARSWQKFCSAKCRTTWHQCMTPEALRKDIETLRSQVAAMAATIEQVQRDADRRDADLPLVP